MSIKVEIYADTVEEYFSTLSQLLAGAAPGALRGSTAEEASTVGKTSTTTRTRPAKPDTAEAGASAATAGASTEAASSGTTAASGASPSEQAKTETKVEPAATAEAPADGLLDFDKHVAPKVLGYVKSHTKDFVSNVLTEFGVAKASELPAERWPELLTALDNAAEAASVA